LRASAVITTSLLAHLSSTSAIAAATPPQEQSAPQHAAAPQTTAAAKPRPHRLSWTYPRFRLWQGIAGVAVTGANLYFQYGAGPFPYHRWNSPILFDEWARGVRADTQEGRDRAARVSSYLWHPTQYYTVFVDSLLVPLAFDRFNLDLAVQMNLLNWQAIGLSFFVLRLTHVTVGRARPAQYKCSEEPGAAFPCQGGPSFIGGHVAMTATGAGLACAHHSALPLYGGGWPDIAVCVVLSASTVAVGVLRGVADKHWASDNILGGLVGGGIGFGLPYLLHYRHGPREGFATGLLPRNLVLAPLVSDDVWGVGVSGFL
jgi:membrane-associated phospholipid phosphatase